MLKHEHFRPIFCFYRVKFVIYLHAKFIIVVNIPRCVRNLFSIAAFSTVPALFRLILWTLPKDRLSAVILQFGIIIEIIWNSHFSSRRVCSGMNRLSVWGKTGCPECLNMPYDFCGFVIFRNNDSVWLEETAKGERMFSHWFGIILVRHLSPYFCGVASGI